MNYEGWLALKIDLGRLESWESWKVEQSWEQHFKQVQQSNHDLGLACVGLP